MRRAAATRVAAALRSEVGVVRLALAVVAVHILDENYLQPEPGTSPGDHLASGLVPIAVLAAVAVIYPRLRSGVRAVTAMTLGPIAITVGVPAVYFALDGDASGDHYTGFLAIPAGIALILAGPIILWRARRRDGTRRRRYLRRFAIAAGTPFLAFGIVWFIVFPIGLAYIYTHTGQGPAAPNLGVRSESVTVTTSDSLDLAASYVPSRNRAAVVLYPGATRPREARMLVRHGYGVLLLDPRGQGRSEGDTVRWAGDRDLLAGLAYLRRRADVDQDRIGAMGFSIGGEMLLETAAKSRGFAAVVSEGAGGFVGDEDVTGPARLLSDPNTTILTAAVTVFGNHGQPPPIVKRIERIAPTAVFLIYADPGIGGESTRQPKYFEAARRPKTIWKVPGSKHTGGIKAQPQEYERRVIAFLDSTLRG